MTDVLGSFAVTIYAAGGIALSLSLVAQNEGLPTTPTTVLGAFIAVSVGSFSLLGWVVRTLFQLVRDQGCRLDALAKDQAASLKDLSGVITELRDAVVENRKVMAEIATRSRHSEDRHS